MQPSDFSFDDPFIVGDLQRLLKILINDKKPLTVMQRKDIIDLLEDYEYNRNCSLAIRKRDDDLVELQLEQLKITIETKDKIIVSQAEDIHNLRKSNKINSRYNTVASDQIWQQYKVDTESITRTYNAT